MLIFVALLYFCFVCALIWLVLFSTGRASVLRLVATVRVRLGDQVAGWNRGGARRAGTLGLKTQELVRDALRFLRHHRLAFAIGVPIVLVPSLLALVMRKPGTLPGYEMDDRLPDAQVAALLKGEQLVPPVALPPLAFTTQEVELVRPMLADASRNWGVLHPDYSQRLLLIFKIMKEKYGYEMALLEGYRSPARQDMLAAMGNQVTNARAFQSWHQYGLAADCAFWRDGKLVISEKDPWAMRGYQLYGQVAESLGLTWGGRWTMMDFGHTELRLRGVMRR
jgi:peptidoglycan L-alanyl-D-glutamate endopeptidase CwlK